MPLMRPTILSLRKLGTYDSTTPRNDVTIFTTERDCMDKQLYVLGEKAASLVCLDNLAEISSKQARTRDPSIKNLLIRILLAAQDEQRSKIIRLNHGKIAGVILDDVVGSWAIRGPFAGKLDAEDACCSVLWAGWSSGPQNIDRPGARLARVVDLHSAVVVQCVLRKGAFAVRSVRRNGSGNLIPASEVRIKTEPGIRCGIVA